MTDAERRFWGEVRRDRLGVRFRRQVVIDGRFIVDFYCPAAKLAVEIDGGQHGGLADAARTEALSARGVTVLRFWNNDVLANPDGVSAAVLSVLVEVGRRSPSQVHPLALPLAVGDDGGGHVALETLDVVFGKIE